jgi:peptidyl-prolyl cis-trans isomerase SurA
MRHSFFRVIAIVIIFTVVPSFAAPKKEKPVEPVKNTTGPEVVDRVAAVVNGSPITLSDLDYRIMLYKKSRAGQKLSDRNSVLDQFINEKIVEQVAEEQSIHVTDVRVDNDIADMMKQSNISDRAVFVKKIETEQGMPFEMFRMQIMRQLLMDQVMTYAVDFTSPSRQDAEEWYQKNKNIPDLVQMNYKQIFLRTRNDSFEEQKAVSARLKELQSQLEKGVSFEELARRESQDPESARNGGSVGWVMLSKLDPMIAGQVYQGYRQGGMGMLRSSQGYFLVKYVGKRTAPFSEVESQIYGMLSFQRRVEQFTKWLERRRDNSEVNIYLEGYVRTKKNEKSAGPVRR